MNRPQVMEGREVEQIEYNNTSGIIQLFYNFAMLPVIIQPGKKEKYFSKIIYGKDEKLSIAIPKRYF